MLNLAAVKATEHGVHASLGQGDIRNCTVFLKDGVEFFIYPAAGGF
jgi:hypothetical protein